MLYVRPRKENGIPGLGTEGQGDVDSLRVVNDEIGGFPDRSVHWTTIVLMGRWSRSVVSVAKATGVSLV
eukprot:11225266-Lingulodinium_polyedra.AAC.1